MKNIAVEIKHQYELNNITDTIEKRIDEPENRFEENSYNAI